MRAVQQVRLTGPEGLELVETPRPEPRPGQLLVRVAASGVAFPDLLMSRGRYQVRPDPPYVPGVELTGTVEAAEPATGFAVGERVAAFGGSGGWADYAVVPAIQTVRVPPGIDLTEAAGLLMNYLTALFALDRRGRLRSGERVLVHGAAGGLGTACVQVAKALGAEVIAVVSTEAKARAARDAGADHAVVGPDWAAALRSLGGGDGFPVDVVADIVGGAVVLDSLRALAPEGRYLVLGFAAGEIPSVAFNRLLLRNVDVVGVGWGPFLDQHPGVLAEQWDQLTGLIGAGLVHPPAAQILPLDRAADALRLLDERAATGKVLLAVSGGVPA